MAGCVFLVLVIFAIGIVLFIISLIVLAIVGTVYFILALIAYILLLHYVIWAFRYVKNKYFAENENSFLFSFVGVVTITVAATFVPYIAYKQTELPVAIKLVPTQTITSPVYRYSSPTLYETSLPPPTKSHVPTKTPTSTIIREGYVVAEKLNVRTGAGVQYSVIVQLDYGTLVYITDESKYLSDGGAWSKIIVPSTNISGWVNMGYISD